MSKVFNFALVGCGRIAPCHVDAIEKCENARLVAVCDTDEQKAREYGEKNCVPSFTDMNEMYDQVEDIDVACILTPSGLHPEHGIVAAKRGINVVTEKPMGLLLADAKRMIDVCDECGVKLFVVKQNRYNPPVQKAREFLDNGAFGELIMGTVRLRWLRDQSYYDSDPWRGTWEFDGGAVTNQACHHVDLLRWFMGDVESVFCKMSRRMVDIEAEDCAIAVLKFKNGALGEIEATTAARPADMEASLSILGSKGSMVIGGTCVNQAEYWKFVDRDDNEEWLGKLRVKSDNVYGVGHVAYINNVCQTLLGNSEPLVDGREGYKSLLLINAMYESAETGKEIFLDGFEPKFSKLGRKTTVAQS